MVVVKERGRVWKICNASYLAHSHTDLCQQTNFFSGQKFVAHFSTTLFFFLNFFRIFWGCHKATPTIVCECVYVRRTNMAVKRPKSWPRTKKTTTDTHEGKVMNYPGKRQQKL